MRALIAKFLLAIDEHVDTRPTRLEVKPADEKARAAMSGSGWKDKHNVLLRRTIANQIAMSNGFVFLHFDGDRKWADHASSENVQAFKELVSSVKSILATPGVQRDQSQRFSPATIEGMMRRLLEIVPFYSIESWLYQNVDRGVELCEKHHRGAHIATWRIWRDNRAALDEIWQPKEGCCLRANFNEDLAKSGWRVDEAYYVGKSLYASLNRLFECEDLCAALKNTYIV
ncbi:MAG: hypothetical protein ACLQVI_03405 [Polyangiaceae bacterium]